MVDVLLLAPKFILMLGIGFVLWKVRSPAIAASAQNKGYRLVVIGASIIFLSALFNILNNIWFLVEGPSPSFRSITAALMALGYGIGTLYLTLGAAKWITAIIQVEDEINRRRSVERELIAEKERAQQASHAKSEFLANMSHEIRTPMNGVLGMIDVILNGEIDKKTRERLEVAHDSGQSLMTILNDILDLSRMESGHVEIERSTAVLRDMIEEAASMLEHQARNKSLELKVAIDDTRCPSALIDPGRYRQIMFNLIGNAIKFSENGTIDITCEVIETEKGDLQLISRIKDPGIGVPEASLPHLFDRFSQADNSATRNHGGTGLGLSICKQLTDLMGGWIRVESRLGEGSTFSFMIPIERSAPSA